MWVGRLPTENLAKRRSVFVCAFTPCGQVAGGIKDREVAVRPRASDCQVIKSVIHVSLLIDRICRQSASGLQSESLRPYCLFTGQRRETTTTVALALTRQ